MKKICQKKGFLTEFPPNLIRWRPWPAKYSIKFCSDWLSGSHFILQTRKFLFINVIAMTLGQGHPKVIQYISQTYTFFVPNILGLAQTVLMWEAKVIVEAAAAAGAVAVAAAAAETNWLNWYPVSCARWISVVSSISILGIYNPNSEKNTFEKFNEYWFVFYTSYSMWGMGRSI